MKGIEYPCERPVAYDYLLKTLKSEASLAHLSCSSFKQGFHSLRRGPGTFNFYVLKRMRVKSLEMVDQFLLKTSKSSF